MNFLITFKRSYRVLWISFLAVSQLLSAMELQKSRFDLVNQINEEAVCAEFAKMCPLNENIGCPFEENKKAIESLLNIDIGIFGANEVLLKNALRLVEIFFRVEILLKQETDPEKKEYLRKALLACILGTYLRMDRKLFSDEQWAMLLEQAATNVLFFKLDCNEVKINIQVASFLPKIEILSELTLKNAGITDHVLNELIKCVNLTKLNLARNDLSDDGVKKFLSCAKLTDLSIIGNCKITNEGAFSLAKSMVLVVLDLRECRIGDDGASALAKNKTLKELYLDGNNAITNNIVADFRENKTLCVLNLRKTGVTLDKIEELARIIGQNNSQQIESLLVRKRTLKKPGCVRILCLDGGGIRGLIPATILCYIAKRVNQQIIKEVQDKKQFYFTEHVDLIAGTSTGGLIALALSTLGDRGKPKFVPETLVDLYEEYGKDIFQELGGLIGLLAKVSGDPRRLFRPSYKPNNLEGELRNYFGDKELNSFGLCRTLIVSFDLPRNHYHLFDSDKALFDKTENFKVRDVARATSAAPTYFPATTIKNLAGEEYTLIDGAVYANNPSMEALLAAQEAYPDAEEYVIISIGTGHYQQDFYKLREKGLKDWGLKLKDFMMDRLDEHVDNRIKYEETRTKKAEKGKVSYKRIQTYLENETIEKMDNVDRSNIENLIKAANNAIEEEHNKCVLEEIVADFVRDYEKQEKKLYLPPKEDLIQ